MDKYVGQFVGTVLSPHPCKCEIQDDKGRVITFTHHDLADLEHLVSEMKKIAKKSLPKKYKEEV